jgi:Ca2+-binding RTX toxin-like protein
VEQAAANVSPPVVGSYKYIAGSDRKNDNFSSKATAGADVFCGFGGNDEIGTLAEGDIFIGGAGGDATAGGANNGIFYGGDGRDGASYNYGTLYGDAGDDSVQYNYGTFNGGDGSEWVEYNYAGATFNGDAGDDILIETGSDQKLPHQEHVRHVGRGQLVGEGHAVGGAEQVQSFTP